MATVDATDYGMAPLDVRVNGTEGRALVGSGDVTVEYWDGRTEQFTNDEQDGTGMDVAVREMVDWLDGESDFPYDATETVQVLEAIAAFHASHARNAAWVELPLTGADREIVVNSG